MAFAMTIILTDPAQIVDTLHAVADTIERHDFSDGADHRFSVMTADGSACIGHAGVTLNPARGIRIGDGEPVFVQERPEAEPSEEASS